MPQKDEHIDRKNVLELSEQFNPVIFFELNSPEKLSQRASDPRSSQNSGGMNRRTSDLNENNDNLPPYQMQ